MDPLMGSSSLVHIAVVHDTRNNEPFEHCEELRAVRYSLLGIQAPMEIRNYLVAQLHDTRSPTRETVDGGMGTIPS